MSAAAPLPTLHPCSLHATPQPERESAMPNLPAIRPDLLCFLKEEAAGSRMEMALLLAIAAALGGLVILALHKLDITTS